MNKDLQHYNVKAEALILNHLKAGKVSEIIKDASIYSIEAGGKKISALFGICHAEVIRRGA